MKTYFDINMGKIIQETDQPITKNPHAQALGRLGGKAGRGHVKARTSEQARQAVMVRWAKRNQAAQLAKQGYTPLPEDCDRE